MKFARIRINVTKIEKQIEKKIDEKLASFYGKLYQYMLKELENNAKLRKNIFNIANPEIQSS